MCWHKWEKWEDINKGKIVSREYYSTWSTESRIVQKGIFIEQQKECSKCGKKKLRAVKTT